MSGTTRDTRLLERAIRERWPITDEMRERIIKRQYLVAISPQSSPRESASAARTIIAADKLNAELEIQQEPQQHLHLHQHSETKVDYSRVPLADLKRIEAELLALSTDTTAHQTGNSSAKPV